VLGRALFDGQIVKGHMMRILYKHLLGWPVTVDDLKAQDEKYYESFKNLTTMPDLSDMYLDFTTTEKIMGARELLEGGSQMKLTYENLSDFLEANIKYRLSI
jgi:E3 ubiquitin-protein ligase NEDD4